MVRAAPHYLLFTESFIDRKRSAGCWRFTLQEVDGPDSLEVIESESCLNGERLELLSVLRGLEALDQPSSVTVVTASRYVTRGFRNGLDSWRDNGWCWERFGQMRRIKNFDLWQRVDRTLHYHSVICRCWNFEKPKNLFGTSDATKQGLRAALGLPGKSTRALVGWSGRKIANWADRTKNWALNFSDQQPEPPQGSQAVPQIFQGTMT